MGPSIEFRLPTGFAIEIDALCQRLGNSANFNIPPGVNLLGGFLENLLSNRQRGNSWESPVLVAQTSSTKNDFRLGLDTDVVVAAGIWGTAG